MMDSEDMKTAYINERITTVNRILFEFLIKFIRYAKIPMPELFCLIENGKIAYINK
jgi:hypothetical protein